MLKFKHLIEEWKDIPDFECYYQASNFGRIRSLERLVNCKNGSKQTKKYKILKPVNLGNGYYRVHLSKDGKSRYWFVHRLVAITFIPNQNNLPFVNHKDENPANNSVWNLEWCDCSYNNSYGTKSVRCNNTRLINNTINKPKTTYQFDLKGKLLATYPSASEAARQLKCSQSSISAACSRNGKSHGYKWSYSPK